MLSKLVLMNVGTIGTKCTITPKAIGLRSLRLFHKSAISKTNNITKYNKQQFKNLFNIQNFKKPSLKTKHLLGGSLLAIGIGANNFNFNRFEIDLKNNIYQIFESFVNIKNVKALQS